LHVEIEVHLKEDVMRTPTALSVLVLLLLALAVLAGAAPDPPGWAYNVTPPAAPTTLPVPPPGKTDETPRHLPDSSGTFVRAQVADRFGPADWYPSDHPVMPDVVRHGRRPDVWACSLCHYPNGKGRPENAGIAGLPLTYFLQTMADFRAGRRKSADPGKANTNVMIRIATAMTVDELNDAAAYFTSMKWTPWIKVVETGTVPKTRVRGGMFLTIDGGATEPIGRRIIETPVDAERTEELRDPRSGFIAYVPKGSLQRGETLVRAGDKGRTTACAVCHGPDLRGLGPVPGLAGRSPSYTARQLYDMQRKSRNTEWTELMAPVVEKLTDDDILAIAAYASSLAP
jgi:cytochrome c553